MYNDPGRLVSACSWRNAEIVRRSAVRVAISAGTCERRKMDFAAAKRCWAGDSFGGDGDFGLRCATLATGGGDWRLTGDDDGDCFNRLDCRRTPSLPSRFTPFPLASNLRKSVGNAFSSVPLAGRSLAKSWVVARRGWLRLERRIGVEGIWNGGAV